MKYTPHTVTHATNWLRAGFTEIIPVIPAGAELHEHSRVDQKARGKCPGEYYAGAWDSLGGWPTHQMNEVKAARYDSLGANVGLRMGGRWCAVDVDVTDPALAETMLNRVHELCGGGWFVRWGQRPKFLILFQIADGETIRRRQYPIHKDDEKQLIEVLGQTANGRPTQAVVAGTHPCGAPYEWNNQPRADKVIPATADQIEGLVEHLLQIADGDAWTRGKPSNVNSTNDGLSDLGPEPFDPSLFAPVCDLIANDNMEYDDWIGIGYAMKNAMGAVAWEQWATFSAKSEKDDPKFTHRTWEGFNPDGRSGFGKLVFWARKSQGGKLPGDLDGRVKAGMVLKQAEKAGLPMETVNGEQRVRFASNSNGDMVANMHNVYAYLVNSDLWNGQFRFNEFNRRVVVSQDGHLKNLSDSDFHHDNIHQDGSQHNVCTHHYVYRTGGYWLGHSSGILEPD